MGTCSGLKLMSWGEVGAGMWAGGRAGSPAGVQRESRISEWEAGAGDLVNACHCHDSCSIVRLARGCCRRGLILCSSQLPTSLHAPSRLSPLA